mmetsp:Transcript_8428/g.31483  ORF Transcript_8428/g.31483 Transcript_8428/m.31483 type:complete len:208 (-) Transcript_8428:1223-1846(-)
MIFRNKVSSSRTIVPGSGSSSYCAMWYMKFATWLNVSSLLPRPRWSSSQSCAILRCTLWKTPRPGFSFSVCIAHNMLFSSIIEYWSPFTIHARLISANKPSPGLYPLPAKPHSVFAKPWVVNSPNLLYVILASASRTFTSRGTNSGVFPAAQRMFATDCVLNIFGDSRHARTTSAFKTSLTPGFITAFPVEIAQTMLDSSMDLKPFA